MMTGRLTTYPHDHSTLKNASNRHSCDVEGCLDIAWKSDIAFEGMNDAALSLDVLDDSPRCNIIKAASTHDDQMPRAMPSKAQSNTSTQTFQTSNDEVRYVFAEAHITEDGADLAMI